MGTSTFEITDPRFTAGTFSAVNVTGLAAGQSATFNPVIGFVTLVPEPITSIMALADQRSTTPRRF